jgi:hypothetical protein
MKKALLYIGIVLCLIGIFPFIQYLFDYKQLSDYGKGFIWGKGLIGFIGISLIVLSRRKKNPAHNSVYKK